MKKLVILGKALYSLQVPKPVKLEQLKQLGKLLRAPMAISMINAEMCTGCFDDGYEDSSQKERKM